jgi:hypothetical protein
MILIRETFVAKPGMASKLARILFDAVVGGPERVRVLTDVVGPFNTVVMETEIDDLATFERRMAEYRNDPEIGSKMAGYTEMCREGRREIYQIVGSAGGRVK